MTDEAEQAYAPAALEALAAFGVEPAELRFVHLSENVTFRATDTRDGSPLVLRLPRPWYHDITGLHRSICGPAPWCRLALRRPSHC
jgi:hypothetical protein